MNPTGRPASFRRQAFTLIELLVSLVIIGILIALIIPVIFGFDRRQKISVAQAQLHRIESAIEAYKSTLGFYPPDNPGNPVTNQLYFELLGTTNNGTGNVAPTNWVTLEHSAQITSNGSVPNINSVFGVQSFANTSPRAQGTDQAAAAASFLDNLTPRQIGLIDTNHPEIKILVCSVEWPAGVTPAPITGTQFNPWRYNSSQPTHNTGSYDLWVDLVIGGKTYQVGNWNQ